MSLGGLAEVNLRDKCNTTMFCLCRYTDGDEVFDSKDSICCEKDDGSVSFSFEIRELCGRFMDVDLVVGQK